MLADDASINDDSAAAKDYSGVGGGQRPRECSPGEAGFGVGGWIRSVAGGG